MTDISGSREIHRLAVVGARVVDGTGRVPVEPATVLIEGDRIVGLGPSPTTGVSADATLIDGWGKFVIPGLVDMHVHVYTPEKWHPELFLAAGVTTVLDLGGQLHDVAAYRAAVESGVRPGPRILFTGPMLEEGEMYAGFAGFCRRFDSARTEAEVDALADAGVDGIKLYVTVRPDTARRACARAHARGSSADGPSAAPPLTSRRRRPSIGCGTRGTTSSRSWAASIARVGQSWREPIVRTSRSSRVSRCIESSSSWCARGSRRWRRSWRRPGGPPSGWDGATSSGRSRPVA